MDDAWWHVFERLSCRDLVRLERVCSRWRAMLGRRWRQQTTLDLDAICPNNDLHDTVAIALLGKCEGGIRELILGERQVPTDRQTLSTKRELNRRLVLNIVSLCPRLTSLTIRRYRIGCSEIVEPLRQVSTSLESLHIESCIMDLRNSTESACILHTFKTLFARCTNLRTFAIVGRGSCYGHLVLDSELLAVVPPSIEHLFISAGDSLKLDNLRFLHRLPRLKTLSAQRSYITGVDLELAAISCPALELIDLSHSRRITDFHNISLCSNLRSLTVDGNRDHFADEHLRAIVRGCTMLESLSVETCAQLSESGLVEIGRCSRLRRLSLWGLGCVTDAVILAVTDGCPLIEHLDLKYCRKVTAVGLNGLIKLRTLRSLFVSGIDDFDREMADRLRRCAPLDRLEANDCRFSKCLEDERQAALIAQMAAAACVHAIARLDD